MEMKLDANPALRGGRMGPLLNLPDELIVKILTPLDITSILNCSEVCKVLRRIVSATSATQFKLELARAKMEVNKTHTISPGEGLRLLRAYNDQWDSMAPLAESSITFPEISRIYDLVDGIFARATLGDNVNGYRGVEFYTLPTAANPNEWTKRTHEDFGFSFKDFAIDPGQDLLVLLEHLTETQGVTLHFHTMSSNTPHPLARTGMGNGAEIIKGSPTRLESSRMHILGNRLAFKTFDNLFMWNWHSGTLLVALGWKASKLTQFSFLSKEYFMLTSSTPAKLSLFEIPSEPLSEFLSAGQTKRQKVALSFSPGFSEAQNRRILIQTAPFVTRHSDGFEVAPYPGSGTETRPLLPTSDNRIQVLFVQVMAYAGVPAFFFVSIKNSWLVQCIEESKRLGREKPLRITWNNWKMHCHWFRTDRIHPERARWIHGGRFIHPPTSIIYNPPVSYTLRRVRITTNILSDFSHCASHHGPSNGTTWSYAPPQEIHAGYSWDLYERLDIPRSFTADEWQSLLALRPRYLVSDDGVFQAYGSFLGYMMDDCRIVRYHADNLAPDGVVHLGVAFFG